MGPKKAGLNIKAGYHSFQECCSILKNRQNWQNDQLQKDFESGVRLAIGTLNLLTSMLPAKIMKLLEFIGFVGNRDIGLQELKKVYEDQDGLRQFLACLGILVYDLVVCSYLGDEQYDIDLCEEILQDKITKYPNGVCFLFVKGRFHFVKGEMEMAIHCHQKSCSYLEKYPKLCHVYYWELIWAHQFSLDWWKAYHYANLLFEDSKWSKCFYAYQKASLLCMVKDDLNENQRGEMVELMKNLPGMKQKLGGKSLPIEKFVIQKANRFLKQGNFLVLPALELIYLWNGFRILGQSQAMIEPVYQIVEKAENEVQKEKNNRMFFLEDICLIRLLKGMCFKFMNLPKQAEECFKFVIDKEPQLITDTYLALYAQFELALKMKSDGKFSKSLDLLEKIQKDKGHHILQLDLRIQTVQTEIQAKINSHT